MTLVFFDAAALYLGDFEHLPHARGRTGYYILHTRQCRFWIPFPPPLPRSWDANFVKELRKELDAAGFASTKLVCGDQLHTFFCAASVNTDPALAAAIYALGSHHPLADDPEADRTGKPLWGTELEVTDPGGTDLASFYASLYANINVTAYTLWNLVSAYNPDLFAPDQGIFRACESRSMYMSVNTLCTVRAL